MDRILQWWCLSSLHHFRNSSIKYWTLSVLSLLLPLVVVLECKHCGDLHWRGHLVLRTSVTHSHLTALCPGLPGWAGTRKVKLIWILLKQETVSGSGISWAICKSAPCSRQITTPVPHHSDFYRPDALPVAQPIASKHWRHRTSVTFIPKNYLV